MSSAEVTSGQEDIYKLYSSISNNIYDSAWSKFLGSMRKKADFKRSGKNIDEYISILVNSGQLSHEELNKFLFNELSFGKHRNVLIYKVEETLELSEIFVKETIKSEFDRSSCDYNELSRTVFINESSTIDEDLAAVKLQYNDNQSQLSKIRLIFVKKTKLNLHNQNTVDFNKNERKLPKYENSYFPIDIDIINKVVIVKNAPKTYISETKNQTLAKYFANKVINAFNLEVVSKQTSNQEALYNMCRGLLENVVQKKSEYELGELEEIVDSFVEAAKDRLNELGFNIQGLNQMLANKNKSIFDIKKQVSNIVENIIVSKILVESSINREGVEGLISYIKFNDESEVKAVLKTKKRSQSLLDSQSYLNLRKTLVDCKFVDKIRVVWYKRKEEISLYYDASDMTYLEMNFYGRLFEEELKYAVGKLNQYSNEENIC